MVSASRGSSASKVDCRRRRISRRASVRRCHSLRRLWSVLRRNERRVLLIIGQQCLLLGLRCDHQPPAKAVTHGAACQAATCLDQPGSGPAERLPLARVPQHANGQTEEESILPPRMATRPNGRRTESILFKVHQNVMESHCDCAGKPPAVDSRPVEPLYYTLPVQPFANRSPGT